MSTTASAGAPGVALAHVKMLVRLALRNLVAHRVASFIVGGILVFGTLLLVVGTTLLANIERAMRRSVTGSLVGDLQLYSSKAKDDLVFYGPDAGNAQDLGVIAHWEKTRALLEAMPNVAALIPMGRDVATAVGGNQIDGELEALRRALTAGDAEGAKARVAHLRQVAELLLAEYRGRAQVSSNTAELAAKIADLERITSDAFWAELAAAPAPALDFLDTRFAPLQGDESTLFIPYVGTDIDAFAEHFESFEIIDGERPPPGRRGLLFNKTYYDEVAKNKIARELDQIEKGLREGLTLAGDPRLGERAKNILRLHKRLLYDLDPTATAGIERTLRERVPEAAGATELRAALEALLTVDDANFQARRDLFYEVVAPHLRLYKVAVGETVTVRAFTRSGYTRAANLKIWGTFRFKGLEDSLVASRYSLVDLMSFRDLYGLMTPERRRELDVLKAEVGVADVAREDAEAALFGGGDSDALVEVAEAAEAAPVADARERTDALAAREQRAFTREDIDGGVVLHAAVLLRDPSRLEQTLADIEALSEREGLELKVASWQKVSGVLGQFIWVMRGVLYVALVIIFLVALVIINNAMLMTTMDRMHEIGTMRAIGAQRGFVLSMTLVETSVLAMLAGGVGALLGVGALRWMALVGLPARHEVLVVLFGGPRLRPEVMLPQIALALGLVALVSLAAAFYPARLATRVAPVVAMQRRE